MSGFHALNEFSSSWFYLIAWIQNSLIVGNNLVNLWLFPSNGGETSYKNRLMELGRLHPTDRIFHSIIPGIQFTR